MPRVGWTEAEYTPAVGRLHSHVLDLRDALEAYASHQSWRCDHPDRYPWEPDCPCGLTKVLRAFEIEMVPHD